MSHPPPGKLRIIAGTLKGRKVPVLSMKGLRPTPDRVRETVFNWLQMGISGARCYNFFAGTGILGFEALSRGASSVTMVDVNKSICAQLTKTCQEFDLNARCQIVQMDVLAFIQSYHAKVSADLIFLDPPFDSTLLNQSLQALSQSPLLGPKTKIYTELPVSEPLPELKGWVAIKSQKAGQVAYHLLAKE